MRLVFETQAQADLQHWVSFEPKIARRILRLIEGTQKDPFGGIGKPEPLKNDLTGWWSKRIDEEHRLIYRLDDGMLVILQCRFHYKK